MQNPRVYVCVIDGEYDTTATVHLSRMGALMAANNPYVFKHVPETSLDPDDYDSEEAFENALVSWYEENKSGAQYFEIIKTEIQPD